jgi:hypothetical protein
MKDNLVNNFSFFKFTVSVRGGHCNYRPGRHNIVLFHFISTRDRRPEYYLHYFHTPLANVQESLTANVRHFTIYSNFATLTIITVFTDQFQDCVTFWDMPPYTGHTQKNGAVSNY